jgi:hypothetical protein
MLQPRREGRIDIPQSPMRTVKLYQWLRMSSKRPMDLGWVALELDPRLEFPGDDSISNLCRAYIRSPAGCQDQFINYLHFLFSRQSGGRHSLPVDAGTGMFANFSKKPLAPLAAPWRTPPDANSLVSAGAMRR